jgi:hypothetical protein
VRLKNVREASYLYSPSCREGFFSETCIIHPHSYTVPGRTRAGLFTGLPRRVLLGNWASGVWGSRKLGFRGFTILGSLVAGKGDSRNLKPRYLFALALGSTPD